MIYIEALGAATIADGVAHVETIHRDAKNEAVRGDDLLIPTERLSSVIKALQALERGLQQGKTRRARKPVAAAPVTLDKDLWAAALQIHRQHGDNAPHVIAQKLDQLTKARDAAGIETWQAIQARVDELRKGEANPRQ